jgi:hypothetical protein
MSEECKPDTEWEVPHHPLMSEWPSSVLSLRADVPYRHPRFTCHSTEPLFRLNWTKFPCYNFRRGWIALSSSISSAGRTRD